MNSIPPPTTDTMPTYSSVITSLVDELTRRSPFLQEVALGQDKNIALFDRNEILTDAHLGSGNFSNVYAVVGFQLKAQQPLHYPHGEKRRDAPFDEMEDDSIIDTRGQQRLLIQSTVCNSSNGTPNYAIKCLKQELLLKDNPKVFLEAATDLIVEAMYLSALNHRHILKVQGLPRGGADAFANGKEFDSFFILSDRIEETIHDRIRRWKNDELQHENNMVHKSNLGLQLASALEYLHEKNIIYRDLKPHNIGINMNGEVVLFDFGFARQLPSIEQSRDDSEETPENATVSMLPNGETVFLMSGRGTRRYMAPEVLTTNRYNLKADVYSWSMVFYEMLTLYKPFFRYSKEQHAFYVCQGGDRPPLQTPLLPLISPAASPASSLSSLPSTACTTSVDECFAYIDESMSDPHRDLLQLAWHQDVSKRPTMKEVGHYLRAIQDPNMPDPMGKNLSSKLANAIPACHLGEFFADFATDLHNISLSACLGYNQQHQYTNTNEPEHVIPQPRSSFQFDQGDGAGAFCFPNHAAPAMLAQ